MLFSYEKADINYKTEIYGAIINFLSIAYVIALQSRLLYANGLGINLSAAITSTVVALIVVNMIGSFIVKLPFMFAPSLGMIISYILIINKHSTPSVAFTVVFLSGVLLLFITVTNLRQKIIEAIPKPIINGLGIGLGAFLIIVCFINVKLIVYNPNTIISLNKLNLDTVLMFLGIAINIVFIKKNYKLATLYTMLIITCIYFGVNFHHLPTLSFIKPNFNTFFNLDFHQTFSNIQIIPTIFSLFLINLFDTTSVTFTLYRQVNKELNIHNSNFYLNKTMLTDSFGAIIGGLFGNGPSYVYVESSAGIATGARSGLATFIASLLFIPLLFCSSVIELIPNCVLSIILFIVGVNIIFDSSKHISEDIIDKIATMIGALIIPISFSIASGFVYSLLFYFLAQILNGKICKISSVQLILIMFSLFYISLQW